MSPTEPGNENVTGQVSSTKPREPKLLFAVAKNVANASTATRSKKEAAPDIKSPISEGKGSMRTMFGIIKRSQLLSPSTQSLRSQRSEDDVKPRHQEAKEVRRSSASAESENHTNATSDSTTKPGQHFVEEVRDTLEKLLTQLDTVDPRKLLAVRLGGELRGLLGKAEDEFAAYEVEFLEHASNEGVSIALQNFGASLVQVSSIAERLRTAKFLLNRTFKGEVLFAFQEINSYYTSLFMELSMAIARRSGINLPLPPPITPPPAPEPAETPAPTGDEICLEAHQYFFGHGVPKNLTKALQLYAVSFQHSFLDSILADFTS
ncbi:hypothetical protein DVH05_007569 [Phytophthora capsici]|nr:hypothetical protein DVH05_004461 [Phytophthora capsici]KAG1693064.1 hypothetical protein DVH05_023845 [Phytophthora capsici]KAG1703625.1 hypothetical protein DVH05_007569 [Phytophthora capsici]